MTITTPAVPARSRVSGHLATLEAEAVHICRQPGHRQRDPDRRGHVCDGRCAAGLAIPAGPGSIGEPSRASLLREARIVGVRCRADGADIIALVAAFQACRAELRRRRQQTDARSVVRSADWNVHADALLDDVLVAIVRGYEGRLGPEPPSTPPGPDAAADRRIHTRSFGSSKRE